MLRERYSAGLVNAELGSRSRGHQVSRFFGAKLPVAEYSTLGIQKFDQATITRIVNAVKARVESETQLTGDEKWNEIARESEKIVRRTQPMYAPEFRSEIGRNTKLHMRLLYAFTSATNAIYNTMKRSVMKYRRSSDWKGLVKDFGIIWFSSAILMTMVNELRALWRKHPRDNEDRIFDAISFTLAPLYFGDKFASVIKDVSESVSSKDVKTFNSERAAKTLFSKIPEATFDFISDLNSFVKSKDYKAGDYSKLIEAGTGFGDLFSILLLKGNLPVGNVKKYGIEPFLKKRPVKTEILKSAKEIDYKPSIRKIFTVNSVKYKYYKKSYDDLVDFTNNRSKEMFDIETFKKQDEKGKKNYIKSIYSTAKKEWRSDQELKNIAFVYKKDG
jgi:hypothetical protein